MGVRRRRVLPAWAGFVLIAMGFLAFVASYFLLPLYVSTVDCCGPRHYAPTAWAFSLNAASNLPYLPVVATGILLLCYLPLLAAVIVVGCSVGFLVHPHRTLATWRYPAWLAGSIALVVSLPFLFVTTLPDIGYSGLLVGYGLLWAGNRVFLTPQP